MSTKLSYSIHKNKWIYLGINTGIDWKITEKMVAIPIFGSLKLSPKLSEFDHSRLFLSIGYGKSFALGRGDLSGIYKRVCLGFDDIPDDFSLFVELADYGLKYNEFNTVGSFSFGISTPLL